MGDFNFQGSNLNIQGGALINTGTITNNAAPVPPQSDELLRELTKAVGELNKTEPMIARSLDELREAVEKNEKPTIKQRIAELSTGMAAEVLKGVAGKVLLAFLGIA